MLIPRKNNPKEVKFTENVFWLGWIPFLLFWIIYYLTKKRIFLDSGLFIFGISTIISGVWEIKSGYHVTQAGYFVFNEEEFSGSSVLKGKNKYRNIIEGVLVVIIGIILTVASFIDFLINSL